MPVRRFNEDIRRFVDYLETLPRDEAIRRICLLAIGAVNAIRADYSLWSSVERTVFNGSVLLFCQEALADDELAEMINFGIQINDLKEFKGDALPLESECQDVEARAMKLLADNTEQRKSSDCA